MSKNFMKNGRWIDNPNKPAVVVCACGNKYIKTRRGQTECIACIYKAVRPATR